MHVLMACTNGKWFTECHIDTTKRKWRMESLHTEHWKCICNENFLAFFFLSICLCRICQTGAIPVIKWPIRWSLCLNKISVDFSNETLSLFAGSSLFSLRSIFFVIFECWLIVWAWCWPTAGYSLYCERLLFKCFISRKNRRKRSNNINNNNIKTS